MKNREEVIGLKKFLVLILLACIFLCQLSPAVSAAEEICASIEPGEEYRLQNVTNYYFGAEDGSALVEREGRTGVQFHYLDPRTTYWYINTDDKVFWSPEGMDAKVYVDYYDEGTAGFTLRYCSVDQQWNDDTEVVFCEDTKQWKTHEFTIRDATFNNRCNNADIVVAQWSNQLSRSTEDVIFGKVRIEKINDPVTVSVGSDEFGNIFGPDEEMALRVCAENKSNRPVSCKIEYGLYDHNDVLLDSASEPFEVGTEGDVFEIRPGITRFGTYTLKGKLTYTDLDGKNYEEKIEAMFSLADKFAIDGEKNKRLGVCSHWQMFLGEGFREKHHTILAEMGANWDRSEIQWSLVENEKGKFSFPAHATMPMTLKDYGLNTLQILDYGNVLYSDGAPENSMPGSPEYIEAFKNYCVTMAEYYKGTVEYFELWNEVNNAQFNTEGAGIGDYAALVKAVVPAIKAVDPNIKVIAPVTINVNADWYREFFSCGTYDYIDCLSTHTYQWNRGLDKDALRREANDLHIVMAEYGEPKPVWISEMGWSTGTKAIWGVDPKERPRMALQAYAILVGEGLADKFFWYNFHKKGNNPYESTYNLGLIEHQTASVTPFAAQDEYVMFTAMNKLIGLADPAEYIRRGDETMLYHFKRYDGDDVILAWAEDSAKTVGMRLGCTTLEKFDLYGNKLGTLTSRDGVFALSAEVQPVYYKGKFSSFEESDMSLSFSDGGGEAGLGEAFTFAVADAGGRELRIEADTELEVVRNQGGELTMRAPGDRIGSFPYDVEVYADGELCYMGGNTVHVRALETSLEMAPAAEGFYQANLTIRNLTGRTPLSGTARLTMGSSGAVLSRPVRFVELQPGASMTFAFSMPEMPKARIETVRTQVTTDTGFVYETERTFDFLTAVYAKEKPAIDGKIGAGEWNGPWFAADQKSNVKQITDWGGPKDSSYFGSFMWDEENFYMAVSATDNNFFQPYKDGDIWQGDGLQFGFSDNALAKTEVTHCTAMAASHTPVGDQLFRSASDYEGERGLIENAEIAVRQDGQKIIYEMAIPWSEIFYEGYVPPLGTSVDFSILMNDNDGDGRRGWLEYNSGIGTGRNYREFGEINFVK